MNIPGLIALALVILMATGCGDGPHPSRVSDTIADFEGDIVEPDTRNLVQHIDAAPIPENKTLAETRWQHLQHKPCDQCHQLDSVKPPKQAAHWDISLAHGSDQVMTCQTCHDPNARMTALKTLTGAPVAFDAAYDLCGQCHFEQRRDWLGGAHGKRLSAWAGQRVIRNCTGCHNPHQPAFPTKMPAMAPGKINTRHSDGHEVSHD